jgi:glycosyltransferase involved in cell wall biosynthesis
MNKKLLSVVIPCYNQGIYLKEALESLDKCSPELFETIIVNDGSTDHHTNEYLKALSRQGYQVLFQENQGLGHARNNGIKLASGTYILPLDADNRIYPDYMTKGIEILDRDEKVAVVYGNANYFGDKSGQLKPGKFNLQRLMMGNYIDACAVIRKNVIEEVGYYDNMKIMGYEDWDLWLRIAFKDYKFSYIDQALFDYRVVTNSMMKTLNRDVRKQNEIEEYFKLKYADKLDFEFVKDYFVYKMKKKPGRFIYRLFLKKYFPERHEKLIRENKMYNGWLYDRS